MAEKVVSVRLQARVEGFTAGMRKAKASVDDLTNADVPNATRAYADLSNKAALAGGAIALGLGVAVDRFADFDQAMSAVKANTGAAAGQMEALRTAAIKLGADSQFSATEAAQGINELAKAGVASTDILSGGLKGALDLAAAGQIEVAQAAETTATALQLFNLNGNQATHVADLLAAGASKAQGGVSDMALALDYAGGISASLGVSIEETAGTLGFFASQGIIGEKAGTSYRSMLLSLTAPSATAREEMKRLGIDVFDAQGKFVGMAGAADELQRVLGPLDDATRTAALGQIFGNESINAAIKLYQGGGSAVRQWTADVNDAGFAAEQAAALTDNLKGDLERLGGAIDTTFIQGGSSANGALRTITQGLEGFITEVGNVPGPLLLVGAGLTATALAAPKAVSSYRAVSASLESIAKTSPAAAKGVNAVTTATKAYGTALVAAAAIGAANELFSEDAGAIGVQQLTRDLLDSKDAVGAFSKEIQSNAAYIGALEDSLSSFDDVVKVAFDPSFFQSFNAKGSDAVKTLTFGMVDLNNASDEAAQRLGDLDGVLSGLVTAGDAADAARLFDDFAAAAARQGVSVDELKAKLPGYAEALAAVDNAATTTTGSSSALAAATDEAQQSAEDAAEAWDKLKAAIDGLGSPLAQQRSASRDFEAAVDAAAEAVKENGKTLDESTDKGRANASALDEIRQATLDKVLADYQLTGSTASATQAMQEGQDAFVKAATDAGMAGDEALALAEKLGLIPEDVTILVSQSGAEAAGAAIDRAARDRFATVWVDRRYRNTDFSSTFQGVGGRASGGPIWGAGTKTSDSVPIWASHGEFMQKAAAVDKYGLAFMHAVNSLKFPTELARGYAHGGPIQPQFAPRMQVVTVPGGPTSHSETTTVPIFVQNLNASDVGDFKRRALDEASWRRSTKGAM